MSALDLINQYKTSVAEKETAKAKQKAESIERAQAFFTGNCRLWLGSVWDEFTFDEVKTFAHSNNWGRLEITFRLPVKFMGVQGDLEQRVEEYQDRGLRWNTAKLDFGYLNFGPQDTKYIYIQLDQDDKANAVMPSPEALGYVLAQIDRYAPIHKQQEEDCRQRDINSLMDFYNIYPDTVRSQLKRAIEQFPDLADQFQAKAAEALAKYEEQQRQQEEETARYGQIEAERQLLQIKADAAWSTPFTLYLISYGAFVDTDRETITRELYSLTEEPEINGYYRALNGAHPVRLIRPDHKLSTEKILVTDCNSAPYEAKRYLQLTSKTLPEASIWVYLPPVEVFAFDIEAVEVETI